MSSDELGAGPRILSVNVGRVMESSWQGRAVRSAIDKQAVDAPVAVRASGLVGDVQADPTVHGGVLKAVYAYPAEHYEHWMRAHGRAGSYPWGMFGENLTTCGLMEGAVAVGDRLMIGGAELMVTQPRHPCRKLEMRFGRPGMSREFLHSGRTGFYLTVIRGGTIRAGDLVEVVPAEGERITIAAIVESRRDPSARGRLMARLARMAGLPGRLREHYARKEGT